MQGIYRWLNPEGLDTVTLEIPESCVYCEAAEITERGPARVRFTRPEDGSPVEFPVVQVWDDPARSPALKRSKKGWRDEDPVEMLKAWEEARLVQFHRHFFPESIMMQVVYLEPPFAEPIEFHRDDVFYEGWRVEMIAAFIAGFKVDGLKEFKHKPKIITDVRGVDVAAGRPNLKVIQ